MKAVVLKNLLNLHARDLYLSNNMMINRRLTSVFFSIFIFQCSFLLLTGSASAQEEARFRKEVKLNLHVLAAPNHWYIGSLAPVLVLENRKQNRHEFELSNFRFSSGQEPAISIRGQDYYTRRTAHALGLRYQYTHSFLPNARISPNLGGSFFTQWYYYAFSQPDLRSFRYRNLDNYNILELVPGLRWRIGQRLGIDYGIALPLLQHSFFYSYLNSQALGNRHYGAYSLSSEPFRYFQSRIGVYFKLFPAGTKE